MRAESLWIRRSLARRGLLAATTSTALVVTFLIVAIAGFAVRSERPAVRDTIAAGPIQTIGLSAETARQSNPHAQDAAARRVITAQLDGVHVDVAQTVSTAPLALPKKLADTAGLSSATVMEDAPSLRSGIRVTAGSWPITEQHSEFPVAVQADAAKLLGLNVGERFEIPSSNGAVHLRVAATWRPRSASAPLWFGDQQVTTGRAGDALGPLVVGSKALDKLDVTPAVRWVVAPRAGTLTPGQLPRLSAGFAHLGTALGADDAVSSTIVTITGAGTATARGMQQSVSSLGAVVSLPVSLLAVGIVLALILLTRLLAETRAAETTLLRARGATAASLMRVTAVESAVVGIGGALIGGAAATIAIAIFTGGLPSAVVLVLPALVVALCVVIVHLGVVGSELRGTLGVARESGRARSVASLGLTVLVVIAAGFALWRFLQYRGTGADVDLAAIAAPALSILAAVMLGLTAFGPLAGLIDRAGSRSSGVAIALPARQVGRGLGFFVAPVALIILAVGGTTLGSGYVGTWSGLGASSAHVVNAGDLRVSTGAASPIRNAAEAAGASAYAALPGVTSAVPAVRMSGDLGSSTVPVVGAPVDGLQQALAPDGGLLHVSGIRAALAPAHARGTHVDGTDVGGIGLPNGTASIGLSLRTSSAGDPATPRSASATVWVADPSGELAPLMSGSNPVGANPDAWAAKSIALPSGPGPWRIVAVDATVQGGAAGDGYSWKLGGLTAKVDSSAHTVAVGQAKGWHVAADAFPAQRAVRPLSHGIGFTAAILDATAGVTIRFMPGTEHRPGVAVTSALAARNGLAIGDSLSLDGVWWTVDATVADIIPVVPGERSGGVLFDLSTLQNALLRSTEAPPATNEVWIASGDAGTIRRAVEAKAGPMASVTIADTAFVDRFFSGAILGLWLGCIGCVVLAVIALAAATAALSRRRRPEVSVFRALGFSATQQLRARSGELWVVAGVSVIIGLAAGALVTGLLVGALARLTVVTAPIALPVAIVADLPILLVGLGLLCAALIGVVLAYGTAVARQAADTEYREETR